VIDEYLRELDRRLPRSRRVRFLAEAEAHLRDSADELVAEGLARDEAERRAVAAFGSADNVARSMAAVAALHQTRAATLVALGALVSLVGPLYLVPENTFGPAQWTSKPGSVAATQLFAVGLWLASLTLVAAAVTAAFSRHNRAAAQLLATATALAVGTAAAVVLADVVWLAHAPWTPLSWALGVVLPATMVALAVAAGSLVLVWTRRPLLDVR
jgi:HAAS